MKASISTNDRYRQMTNEALIQMVIAGQQQAYAVLVNRHERLLHSILQRYLNDPEAVKEVVQDTFLRAFRFLSNFRGESKFSTWLCKIAISIAISRLKTRRYSAWVSWEDYQINRKEEFSDGGSSLEKEEASQLIRRAIQRLDARDATALELFYFREQSIEEIGQLTGWTTSNIKSRLSRARQRLQGVLEQEGFRQASLS